MNVNQKLDQFLKLSQKIKSQEPPAFTPQQKQAAITMADMEKCLYDLISEGMPLKIIYASLFWF